MELLYIIDGSINVLDEGKSTELNSNDVYFVGHDSFHKTFTSLPDENIKYLVVLLSYEKIKKYYPNIKQLEFDINQSNTATGNIRKILKEVALYFEEKQSGYEMKLNSLMHDIYYVLMSQCKCDISVRSDSISTKELEYVKTAIEYMGQNYLENLTLNNIADKIGLSSSYFSRCFKSITRTSVMQYLANIRLESALQDIVNENKSVTDAAFDNGFTSTKSFIELCKKVYDCTPKQYKFKYK